MTDEQIRAIFYPSGQANDAQLQIARGCARAIEAAASLPLRAQITDLEIEQQRLRQLAASHKAHIADLERRVKLTSDRWQVECDNKDERIAELDRLLTQTSGMNELQRMRIAELEAKLAQRVPEKITEEMHVAAVKVLHRASGVDGLPQRMLDAMISAAPAAPEQQEPTLAEQERDAIAELNHAQWLALENVRLLAARHRSEEWAQHMLRFVDEAGTNKAQITRDQVAQAPNAQQAEAQEPCAWLYSTDQGRGKPWASMQPPSSQDPQGLADAEMLVRPLFTRPQPAQLERLSEEEKETIWHSLKQDDSYTDIIQSALAAKNGVNLK